MLPNFLYSTALAHYFLSLSSDNDKHHTDLAEQFLESALCRFPFLLGQILDKLSIQPDSKIDNNYYLNTLAFNRETEGIKMITNIFLHHSLELWRLPNPHLDEWSKKRRRIFVGMPQNLIRHAVLHSIQHESSASNSIADPCPPPSDDTQADYDPIDLNQMAGPASTRNVSSSVVMEFMRSLLPPEYQPQLDTVGGTLRDRFDDLAGRFMDTFRSQEEESPTHALLPDTSNEENLAGSSLEPIRAEQDSVEDGPNTSNMMVASQNEEEGQNKSSEQTEEEKNEPKDSAAKKSD
uniref:Uncharacterized protein n=1 Tax=Ditylenchus dipsaci TaxID=166011 RepID=A0A915DD08_9BILA